MDCSRAANFNHFGLIAWQQRAKPVRLKQCVVYIDPNENNSALLQTIIAQCFSKHYRVTILNDFNEETLTTLKPDLVVNFGLTFTTHLLTLNAPLFNTLRTTSTEKRKFYNQVRALLVTQ